MEDKYKKIEWEKDDVIAFPDNQVRKADLILENLKKSVQYKNWGQNLNQNLSSNLKLDSSKIILGNNPNRFSQWFEDGV